MYCHTVSVNYANDIEYRDCLSAVFGIDATENDDDEIVYDDKKINNGLDYIYAQTKDVLVFRDIYLTRANKMLLTDPEIGMVTVFSYDYFDLFHLCLVDFFRNGITESDNYDKLHKKIS